LLGLGASASAQGVKEFTKSQSRQEGSKDLVTFQGRKGTKHQGWCGLEYLNIKTGVFFFTSGEFSSHFKNYFL
jgi:hypothetical protein